MHGLLGKKEAFANFCCDGYDLLDGDPLPDKVSMDRGYEVFLKNPQPYDSLESFDSESYLKMDSAEILSKKIVGSSESTVGTFFKSLQNSDWAHRGMEYLPYSDGKCPFCMSELSESTITKLKKCFDEDYRTDIETLSKYERFYLECSDYLLSLRDSVIETGSLFGLKTAAEKLFDDLDKVLRVNCSEVKRKVEAPSETVSISTVSGKINELGKMIDDLNEKIVNHNKSITDNTAKGTFIKNLKKTCAKEIESEIGAFVAERKSYEEEINKLNNKIEGRDERKKILDSEIEALEEQISNIHEVVEKINKILKVFGFTGFKLQVEPNSDKWYQIVRSNGDCAHETLSEGERNFIAFLYFCHMIKGSPERSGTTNPKIVLIDDPITSMDNNVMFIVGSLTKDLINDKNNVEQLFLFTHNIYFFKEVSPFQKKEFGQEPKYFVVEKKDGVTGVTCYKDNPIRSSYELIWEEYKGENPITVFNAMRRILEQYLGNFCGTNLRKMPDNFEGEDKIICKALIASLHYGSHGIPDDIMYCAEKISIESNKRVFREIFEKNNHLSHYDKMTGNG